MLNVNRDKIFVKENTTLLRKTGKGIFLYNVFTLISILTGYYMSVIMNQPQAIQLSWAYRSVIYPIILAFFCWIIAEVFALGIKLKEEQELTIYRKGEKIMSIIVNVDVMMAKRKMSSQELAEKIGITQANLSILKTGKAKAVRFSTLEAICQVLDCQPGDILEYRED